MALSFSFSHLSDPTLLRDLAAIVVRDRGTTAELLAYLAEVDARKLYLAASYPSMYAYCVEELHMSEDATCKRIRAARAARQFPMLFVALAEGRVHLSAVVVLAPHLTPDTVEELVAAAAHKNKFELEQLLARRFPRPELPARLQALSPPATLGVELEPGPIGESAPGRIGPPAPRPKVVPLAPERFALQFTIDQVTHDDLRYAQALLSHQVTSGDVASVFGRALKALIGQLEKRKFAATTRPRHSQRRPAVGGRHIPAAVKRAVWERDQGRCTFVSDTGRRCSARALLEFDHADPVARGGRATVERIRLRCRAHNQYEAERAFGVEFMSEKREGARRVAAHARKRGAEARERAAATEERARAAAKGQARDVLAGLRELGFRAGEARRAAELSETLRVATLEERMRAALKFLCRRPAPVGTSMGTST